MNENKLDAVLKENKRLKEMVLEQAIEFKNNPEWKNN
jgi:hypothetical protein